MSRLKELEDELFKIRQQIEETQHKKKFKMPFGIRRMLKKAKDNNVVIQYLTQNYQVKFMMKPIVQGNLVVVGNKAYELNPKAIWRWKKYPVYIIREIDRLPVSNDRNPVSNEDYDELKKLGRATDSDVTLIKAVLGAVQKPTSPLQGKKGWIIGIIIAIVIAVIIGAIFWPK